MRRVNPSLAHRLFYPGVPAVLAARSGDTVAAMPVVSYVSLSENPPLFGVSCTAGSFTLKVAIEAKAFSLCILGKGFAGSIATLATTRGRRGRDKLADAGLGHVAGKLGAPVISRSVAALECSLLRLVKTGDHTLLVGKIESVRAVADFQKYWRFKEYAPILYTGWQKGMSTYGGARGRTSSRRPRTF